MKKKRLFEGFGALFCVFNYSLAQALAYLFNVKQSLLIDLFAVVVLLIGIVSFLVSIRTTNSNNEISKHFLIIVLLCVFILSNLFLVYFRFGYLSKLMRNYILSFGTRAIGAILIAYSMVKKNNFNTIYRWILPFSIFYTPLLLYLTIKNSSSVSYLAEFSERQSFAYAASYLCILLFLLLKKYNSVKHFSFFSHKVWKIVIVFNLILNLIIISICKGRGAILLFGLGLLFFLFSYFFKNLSAKSILKSLLIVAAIAMVFLIIYNSSPAFKNLINNFTNGLDDRSSNERREIYNQAMAIAKNNIIFGTGAGSTAYLLEIYSHNIFIDIIVEYGVIGMMFFSLILLFIILKFAFLRKKEKNMDLLFCFFLCGFVILLFSSTYYTESSFWLGTTSIFLFSKKTSINKESFSKNATTKAYTVYEN